MKCQGKTDCETEAAVSPKLHIPAKGWPLDQHTPMSMMVGLNLCRACYATMGPENFLGAALDAEPNNLRRFITTMTSGAGLCPPDFDRAFLTPVPIDGQEWQEFTEVLQK